MEVWPDARRRGGKAKQRISQKSGRVIVKDNAEARLVDAKVMYTSSLTKQNIMKWTGGGEKLLC